MLHGPVKRLSVVLLIAIAVAGLVLNPAAQASALEAVARAANETKIPKKAGSPHDPSTLRIVTDSQDHTELIATVDVATLIGTGQETGPHSEEVLRIRPMAGRGGLQQILDVLTLPDADMTIVPVPLLDRAPAALGLSDLRKSIVYVAPLFVEEFHLLTSELILNIKDLAGKTVNLGVKDSAVDVLGRQIFDSLGLGIKVINLDQIDAVNAVKKYEIGAALVLAGKPEDSLARIDGLQLIPLPRVSALDDDFVRVTLTHDDYPNLIPCGANIETVGVRSVLIAYNWPRGSDPYNLMEFFVRTLFSRFPELQTGQNHPKWGDVHLAASLRGWAQFPPAQRWLDERGLESFLSERGIDASPGRTRLFQDILSLRK
jgi:uncharacterized protein